MTKISKKTFDEEIEMCKRHFLKNGKCAWGKCENCGVPLLLKKLYLGEIIDDAEAVQQFKTDILK